MIIIICIIMNVFVVIVGVVVFTIVVIDIVMPIVTRTLALQLDPKNCLAFGADHYRRPRR
jgi:hypothetical protein